MLRMEVNMLSGFIKKFLAALVAVVTFGVITPSHEIWNSVFEIEENQFTETHAEERVLDIGRLIDEAREQSDVKFGSKIQPRIQQRYEAEIFPFYKQKIEEYATASSAISHKPSGDYGEKIFHLYDQDTNADILRAHVRVEKRPLEGYYFTFHYHTHDDQFAKHQDIGEIYWSKNTPPKWLS
ncbi:YpjP family protein [Chryseomicrobium aureum]|uniref:YpjP family protein n=1 Tax=Chryseomicrobium aureum TaxID=1441723 RepID=UPI00370D3D5E